MRKTFETQLILGGIPIKDVKIPSRTSNHLANLAAVLQYIYENQEWNQRIFKLLSDKLIAGKKHTGRMGMSLWELFVLAQVRLCKNISYDELHHIANHDLLIRGLMGVLTTDSAFGLQYEYQNIYDNVKLLDDALLEKINDVIVELGHEVFKKEETEALRLKTDSFVVETDTHFPTDYNLLWDSTRKCIDKLDKLAKKHSLQGWRKSKNWRRTLNNQMRNIGEIARKGGSNKQQRLEEAAQAYLTKAQALKKKVQCVIDQSPCASIEEIAILIELVYYHEMLVKHIDLVDRRLLQGETIPHDEKVFSIFQPYTEWINKGKLHPNVEIGKKLAITTDQYHLIVDWQIAERQSDNQLTIEIADRLLNKYPIESLSTDKGFSDMSDKALLKTEIPLVIMPKKGKRNQEEEKVESSPLFKRLKNKHSAVESNINELEHRGLDRCPDRTRRNFNRYTGLAVTAYNLHKIGRKLNADRLQEEKDLKAALKKAA